MRISLRGQYFVSAQPVVSQHASVFRTEDFWFLSSMTFCIYLFIFKSASRERNGTAGEGTIVTAIIYAIKGTSIIKCK